MTSGSGTGPATFTASAEPGSDVRVGNEHLELPQVHPQQQGADAADGPIVTVVTRSRDETGRAETGETGQLPIARDTGREEAAAPLAASDGPEASSGEERT